MLRLHETTRRRVCRTLFVLLCVTPTLATAAWIVHSHRPWRVHDEEQRLGGLLHVDVQLADWREPRPGAVHTASLKLVDATAAAALLEAGNLAYRRNDGVERLVAQTVVMAADQWSPLAARLNEWLERTDTQELHVSIARLEITGAGAEKPVVLEDVEGIVRRDGPAEYQGQIAARLADQAESARVQLIWSHGNAPAGTGAATQAFVDASGVALPAWVFRGAAPALAGAGPDATFTGTLRLEFDGRTRRGAAAGRLANVAIESLLPAGGPHTARGRADFAIDELRWNGPAIERIAGVVQAEDLEISRSLVVAASMSLFCGHFGAGTPSPGGEQDRIAVERLACRFAMDDAGLAIEAALPLELGMPPECLAASGGRPLLLAPVHPRLPAGAWVQFLAGPSKSWVPATRDAIERAARLPLP